MPYRSTLPLPVFPEKSLENNNTPGIPGISSKFPESHIFCLIQVFPENSSDSRLQCAVFFQKICTLCTRTSNSARHFQDLISLAYMICTDRHARRPPRRRLIEQQCKVEPCCLESRILCRRMFFWWVKLFFMCFVPSRDFERIPVIPHVLSRDLYCFVAGQYAMRFEKKINTATVTLLSLFVNGDFTTST